MYSTSALQYHTTTTQGEPPAHVYGVGGNGGRCVDFDEPRLEVVVDQDIVAVHLEAMLVVHDHLQSVAISGTQWHSVAIRIS